MSGKAPKRPRDTNQLAKAIVDLATDAQHDAQVGQGKDADAVALGRRGGLKGGRARAAKLTPKERSDIARKAAAVRWSKDEA